ncbi:MULTISPECIES: low temperature requirement protein A [unclassified Streptomyces]|uniref:low temperature requirement protein A n=1 Tax=unclassified Streptomyces TaxID=2593676 RepID=UPI002DD7ECD3|nr:low temperature requirement protein A [Streptomyces sp. NBC_00243]WRZ20207.1 low temperature requirement protein A [Streptomyces sp. NBC_00243]
MAATEGGHRVTPAELFFDLVFVYAITQVTALMAADPTAQRLLGAGVVLALLWWCWCCFAWLGNVVRADSGPMFGVLIAVMAVVLVVSLTVPEVYTDAPGGLDAPLVFVLCYGAVRILHLVTYWLSDREDQALHATLRRTALLSVAPPFALLLVGSAFTGITQILIWLGAVLIDYLGIYITGSSGWRVASPGHFSERHGLIVIIALGESIVAIGVGVSGLPLNAPVLLAAPAGLLVVAGLWRLYFRRLSEPAEHRLAALEGDDRTRFARDVYTFLHLPLVAGVVLTALGMKKALQQVADTDHYDLSEPLHGVVAWALTGGVGIFVLAAAAILLRTTGRASPVLAVGGLVLLCAGPAVAVVPALLALTVLAAATALLLLDRRTVTHEG